MCACKCVRACVCVRVCAFVIVPSQTRFIFLLFYSFYKHLSQPVGYPDGVKRGHAPNP